jgi:transposase
MEATGGYERDLRIALQVAGFAVVVHQPAEVHHFVRFKRIRHKNDKSDALVIARATALSERTSRPRQALQEELSQIMTFSGGPNL